MVALWGSHPSLTVTANINKYLHTENFSADIVYFMSFLCPFSFPTVNNDTLIPMVAESLWGNFPSLGLKCNKTNCLDGAAELVPRPRDSPDTCCVSSVTLG